MRTLQTYIDTAIKRNNLSSMRRFCDAIGVSHNATTAYNNGSLPSDETMIKIADLAGIDRMQALADLNTWRAPERYKSLYTKMGEIIRQAALCFAPALFTMSVVIQDFIYYGN